uniref:Chaperone protein dnaJ 1 n=1 Tax=Aegilops tauschii TaxID=37682 RepID=N1R5R4_AEGTA
MTHGSGTRRVSADSPEAVLPVWHLNVVADARPLRWCADVEVRILDGTSELRIPPGTQPGDVLVLAKQGVPSLNRPSIRGDHLFAVKVSIPNRISGREKELLEELASLKNGGFASAPVKPKPVHKENGSRAAPEVSDQPDDGEGDWLKKLSDFAG